MKAILIHQRCLPHAAKDRRNLISKKKNRKPMTSNKGRIRTEKTKKKNLESVQFLSVSKFPTILSSTLSNPRNPIELGARNKKSK